MQVLTKSLTEAHHKFGDILYEVRRGCIVGLRHGNTEAVIAYVIPPALMEHINEYLAYDGIPYNPRWEHKEEGDGEP